MSNPNGQNPFAWGNYQIGGGMANQSMVWLDGSPVNGSYINITALIPTQDSLQEFKVATNNLSPEYGRFAGGVVNFTTKSGTNELHGTLWEYLRNKDLDANDFFSNQERHSARSVYTKSVRLQCWRPCHNSEDLPRQRQDILLCRLRRISASPRRILHRDGADRTGAIRRSFRAAASQGVNIYDPLTTCGTGAPGTPAVRRGVAPAPAAVCRKCHSRQPYQSDFSHASELYLPNAPGNAQGVGNWISNAVRRQ